MKCPICGREDGHAGGMTIPEMLIHADEARLAAKSPAQQRFIRRAKATR